MTKSLLSNERECYVCHDTFNVHKHHIFHGTANRKKSEQDGCWVYLCPEHHNMSNEGVHQNHNFDMRLKAECQEKWEEINGTREDFIKRYGRSYL